MKRIIAIMAGGDTSEHEVSLRSARGIYSFISEQDYVRYIVLMRGADWKVQLPDGRAVDVDKNDFGFDHPEQGHIRFDFAYITVHGTPGEDGRLQGYLDMMGVPYSCCGVFAASMTYNKFACNQYLKAFGLRVAESLELRRGDSITNEEVESKIGLPCFIKPSQGGSSFGVTKVKTREQIQPAIEKAFAEAPTVMIESFVGGTEVTCGCYLTRKETVVLPITEVVTKNEFFDYAAKYNGESDEITPARIPEDTAQRVRLITQAVYRILGCEGLIRVDYIITPEGHINLLEVNTTPGMTPASFIPQQVRAAGRTMESVMADIIENKF